MNVLVLSKYDTLAASSRLRFHAYRSYLEDRGIHLTLSPLFNNAYLGAKFHSGSAPLLPVVKGFAARAKQLMSLKKWDLILLQYELFPYLPAGFESALVRSGLPYVVDYDDAIFHMYDDHPNWFVRSLLSDKIGKVMRGARSVIAGSKYLADYARRYNDSVNIIPTVVDLRRYRMKDWESTSYGPFTVGWIGSPSTVRHLTLVQDALVALSARTRVRLIVIGATAMQIDGIEIETHPWSEDTEVDLLRQCDVGIMPLHDEPFTRGKCAFKLIQYMACALPTVTSPVGANVDVVTKETGLYAANPDQWLEALSTLSGNADLQRSLGSAGRQRCERHFSLTSQSARLEQTLLQAASQSPTPAR